MLLRAQLQNPKFGETSNIADACMRELAETHTFIGWRGMSPNTYMLFRANS